MLFKSLFVVAAAALAANAQSASGTSSADTATPSVSTCIVECSTQAAATAGCSSFTDLACVCTSTAFQTAAGTCLQANCTAAEVTQAEALQQTECAALTANSTATSATLSATSGTTSPTTATSSKSTPAATSSGAAAGLVPSLALNSAFGGLVALAGSLIGAALVI